MSFFTKVKQYPKTGLVILSFIAFVALGMPDGFLGVAWPSIRSGFSIPLDALGMFLTALVIGYMTSSFFSGPIVTRVGVGKVLAISCTLTGIALFGYTFVPVWWMMVLLGVVAGFGSAAMRVLKGLMRKQIWSLWVSEPIRGVEGNQVPISGQIVARTGP